MTFTKRPLAAGETLGDRLRKLRTESGLTIGEMSHKIQIAEKHLLAIEETRYRELPGQVYARQFVRRYAEALQTDIDGAVTLFDREYTIVAGTGQDHRPLITARVSTDFPWLRRHVRLIAAAAVILIVVAYLGVQATQVFLPPVLTVNEPDRDLSTPATKIMVVGSTDPQATVTINDQEVQITSDGTFNESVDLHPGLNTLRISSIKKHSQARIVIRQVLVETGSGPS